MRLVKLALISIVIFSLLILVFSLLFPSEVRISRAINIDAKADTVALYLNNMQKLTLWNEMANTPDLTNKSATNNVFTSDQLKIKLLANATTDTIKAVWKKSGSREIHSVFNIIQAQSNTTVVQWYFDFKLKWYPWEKFGSIVFDKQLGPSMEKSLMNLKKLVENSP